MTDNEQKNKKLSTTPYKGVRDFYPRDLRVQNHIFKNWRKTAELYGFEEYSASILEPSELYEAKSGDELVNEEMYVFEDRGGRRVALRPEMTPTLARMIAGKKRELLFPARLFTIANMFRYQRPQRGRLREHWQLNCDILGLDGIEPEIEIILLASRALLSLGLTEDKFIIKINNRILLQDLISKTINANKNNKKDNEIEKKIIRIIDKRDKIKEQEFQENLIQVIGEKNALELTRSLNAKSPDDIKPLLSAKGKKAMDELSTIFSCLKNLNINNAVFSPCLARGLDYYTGIVFEIFDTNPVNKRALFGGGRYNNLSKLFQDTQMPAVGFGMGDVAVQDALQTYKLIPDDIQKSKTALYICILSQGLADSATSLAEHIRREGIPTVVDYTYKKVGDQIKRASKDNIPLFLCFGKDEKETCSYKIKNLQTNIEKKVGENDMIKMLKSFLI